MFKWLNLFNNKRKYKITVTERVGDISSTYIIEVDDISALKECVDFAKLHLVTTVGK